MFITSSGGCALKYQTLLKPKLQCSLFPRRFFRVAQLNTRRYVSLFRRKSLHAISAYILEHGLIMDISAWSCTDVTVRTPQATSTDKNYISKTKTSLKNTSDLDLFNKITTTTTTPTSSSRVQFLLAYLSDRLSRKRAI